jgi:hypothetical protein
MEDEAEKVIQDFAGIELRGHPGTELVFMYDAKALEPGLCCSSRQIMGNYAHIVLIARTIVT